jgi:hypothetical protein
MAGTPYIIARIMEILPPNSVNKKASRQINSSEVLVRVSLYYRPSDVSTALQYVDNVFTLA